MSGSSRQLTLKKGAPRDQVLDLLCVQLRVNEKFDYDYDHQLGTLVDCNQPTMAFACMYMYLDLNMPKCSEITPMVFFP